MQRGLLLSTLLLSAVHYGSAAVACSNDETCAETLRDGSVCVNGFCTNPFYRGGCLAHMYPEWTGGVRTCSSADGPEALQRGYCRPSAMNYAEVRIASHNWDSAYFSTWIMQVVLSEMLNVPVSIETADPDSVVDFYEETKELGFGRTSYDWDGLAQAATVGGDCSLAENGTSCAHFFLEGWFEDLPDTAERLLKEGKIEDLMDLGALGETATFIPKLTGKRDPTLLSYLGIQGEANRRKLAARFLRPATWGEYCTEVSHDGCASADVYASRKPNGDEKDMYFLEDAYTGHFRPTEENDCDRFPTSCTGLLVDYPCGWQSNAAQQMYHLEIALEVVSFSYNEMLQIIAAANATKSDIAIKWWTPTSVFDQYYGTDMEMTTLTFPIATQECLEARVDRVDRCSDVLEVRVGDSKGACGETAVSLSKAFSSSFKRMTQDPNVDEALWSPAYETVRNFQISHLQISEINQYWIERDTDEWNYDPREATCRWIVENFDDVLEFLPQSYPRSIQGKIVRQTAGSMAAVIFAAATLVLIVCSSVLVCKRKTIRSVHNAQIEFLGLYFFGLFLVAIASLVSMFPTSNGNCGLAFGCSEIGHILLFVLLAVKMDAINRYANAGKVMQRVRLSMKQMLIPASLATGVMFFVLVLWSVDETIQAKVLYELTGEVTDLGEHVIRAANVCYIPRLEQIVTFCIVGILLVYTLVLGFMMSRGRNDINSGKNMTMLAFSHGFLLSFRFLLFLIEGAIEPATTRVTDSFLLSIECFVAILIFIAPKIFDQLEDENDEGEPLPDLFLNATILIADLVGFTKWSSMREPAHVFKMLETIYGEFDVISDRCGTFKVETVGDSYGIPDSGTKVANAVKMAKFAAQMLNRMNELSKELETVYGPDTAKLSVRIGAHSGQVTGGYLRGKQSRFQLFGDTINVASRMESNGLAGRIQFSDVTAHLLQKGGGENWVEKRNHLVAVKGKGAMQTYWLTNEGFLQCTLQQRSSSSDDAVDMANENEAAQRKERLVDWNTSELYKLLRKLVAHQAVVEAGTTGSDCHLQAYDSKIVGFEDPIPLGELKEVFELPPFNEKICNANRMKDKVKMNPLVKDQLRRYVKAVADHYPENEFHNFAHASHVALSVIKYLNRIASSSQIEAELDNRPNGMNTMARLHAHTFGIATEPLVQFSCVFSALVHDIDHPGVPNAEFLTENRVLAKKYDGRSIAEQNSIDVRVVPCIEYLPHSPPFLKIAWNLLFQSEFRELRLTICRNKKEVSRFRQLLVNTVLSTDIVDKHLKNLRNARWDKAFNNWEQRIDSNSLNRKATAVIEHLIQAADISHTMQHWHVYLEWNEKLFREMYSAFLSGRSPTNPADLWYDGEIGFFDYYVIPLSERLRDSGVFGVTSDENLGYARANREEWVEKGQAVVAKYIEDFETRERCHPMDMRSQSFVSI